MKLSIGEVLVLVSQVVPILQAHGVLGPNGDWLNPSAGKLSEAASAIESQLRNDGVAVPAKVDLVIKSLPLIFALVG